MTTIEKSEIKPLLLEALIKFDEICKDNNLRYSLAYGTLIGAVRHKGFIPWDDDIDVVMPRDDYEKLLSLRYNDGRYEIKSSRYNKNYFYTFAKLSDNSTYVVENSRDGQDIGLYVDIFPFDYVSEKDYLDNYDKLHKIIQRRAKFYGYFGPNTNEPNRNLSFKKIVAKYAHKMLLPISAKVMVYGENKYISKTTEKYCAQFVHSFYGMKNSFKTEEWDNLIKLPFENVEFNCFKNYDEILTKTYGDYMTPPENVTASHDYCAYYI